MRHPGRALILALGMTACSQPAGERASTSPPAPPPVLQGADVEVGAGQEVDLLPEQEPPSRSLKRMDIAQLDAAMRAVTGGLYWTDDASSGEGDLFVELAGTLGVPDYAVRTAADLDPSLIFQKYLGDAARSVCWQLVERERSAPASRVLMKRVAPTDTWEAAPDKIDDNLKWLLLRFHGHATGDDTTALELWRWLFRSAALVSQDPVVAWRTVCVGLITHPDFYLY